MIAKPSATVIEIVEFRLIPGIDETRFLAAAAGTRAFLDTADGFIRRTLSRGDDGAWIDCVEWRDLDTATSAAKAAMEHKAMAPFLEAIDFASVSMRHARLKALME